MDYIPRLTVFKVSKTLEVGYGLNSRINLTFSKKFEKNLLN